MSDVTDLIGWLRAQIDDDEQAIHLWAGADVFYDTAGDTGDYVERFGTDRMQAEVEAKRRLLELHRPVQLHRVIGGTGAPRSVTACWYDTDPDAPDWVGYPCQTLRLLALPYADRPGYRPEWRPL